MHFAEIWSSKEWWEAVAPLAGTSAEHHLSTCDCDFVGWAGIWAMFGFFGVCDNRLEDRSSSTIICNMELLKENDKLNIF